MSIAVDKLLPETHSVVVFLQSSVSSLESLGMVIRMELDPKEMGISSLYGGGDSEFKIKGKKRRRTTNQVPAEQFKE